MCSFLIVEKSMEIIITVISMHRVHCALRAWLQTARGKGPQFKRAAESDMYIFRPLFRTGSICNPKPSPSSEVQPGAKASYALGRNTPDICRWGVLSKET